MKLKALKPKKGKGGFSQFLQTLDDINKGKNMATKFLSPKEGKK